MMLTRNGYKLKIGDLGLAHSANGSSGAPEDVMITPLYAAPEIITTQQASNDPRSDIYSFGVMFYELACGTAPFTGNLEDILQSHLYAEPRPLLEMNPDMDKELAVFIDSLLAKNPDDRPADWKKVRAGLLSVKRRLFPASAVSGGGVKSSRVVRSTSTGSSWSAEAKDEKEGIFKKLPWLMPAVLIVVIVGALLYMAIEMGFFK
jgi:serine/threonine protein kinase